jgi:hypothetical protein
MFIIFVPLVGLTFNYNFSIMRFGIQPNLQGLSTLPTIAEIEREKADILSSSPTKTVYFTVTPSMIGFMSGRHNPSLPFDPFGETWTMQRFEDLVNRIIAEKPDRILIELQNSPLLQVSEPRQAFFARLRGALTGPFVSKGEVGGWELWEPDGTLLGHSAGR